MKYRNNSSRLISGNDRNCSYCSRENIFSDTSPMTSGAPAASALARNAVTFSFCQAARLS